MYEIPTEEYQKEVDELRKAVVEKIRQQVYEELYNFVAQHVDSPDDHEGFINELVDSCLSQIKESL